MEMDGWIIFAQGGGGGGGGGGGWFLTGVWNLTAMNLGIVDFNRLTFSNSPFLQ